MGLFTLGQSSSGLYLGPTNPELIKRRGEMGEGTKAWDMACLSFFGTSYLGILIVAAMDAGRGWSAVPVWLVPVGAGQSGDTLRAEPGKVMPVSGTPLRRLFDRRSPQGVPTFLAPATPRRSWASSSRRR